MKKFTYALVLVFATLSLAHAQYKQFSRKGGLFSLPDKIDVYFFDSKSKRLHLKDEESVSAPKYGSLKKAMDAGKCEAGVNGNFFGSDEKGTPIGMTVEEGKKLPPDRKSVV